MKLLIITAPDNVTEAWTYAHSLVELAISLDNSGYAVRAIEELPKGAIEPREMPHFGQLSSTWPLK